jgi:glycyl-tRNA synthetase beta chain
MMAGTLLVELLTEELPPKALKNLSDVFAQGVFDLLQDNGFTASGSTFKPFCSPRRLAVSVSNVIGQQADRVVERKGPAVASGVDAAGKPTKALDGFLRSAGVAFEQLAKTHDGKAEYFVARIEKKGEPLANHLAGFVSTALKKLPIPKVMRWGDTDHQFVRPVHGLVMLLDGELVAGEVLGLQSRRVTLGHRFLSQGEIKLAHANEYVPQLNDQGKVMVDVEARKAKIAEQLAGKAKELKATINPAEGLLDEVTALVEWPVVYVGEFEKEFLEVPQECLILTMQQNQKYFPLLEGDGPNKGKLLNKFLIVSNMAVADPKNIVTGNARVVRPRLSDARFFFNQDRKVKLETRLAKLANVVYHNKIGTQMQRVERLARLAKLIAHKLHGDATAAERAARLAKADLVTDMVGEFPELQGIMGRYYALADGESAAVADAIEAHYRPRFAGDVLPAGNVAVAVSLADKRDSLVGFFGIGQLPTGDKDPFALRRAALGVLRLLIESPLPLPLDELIRDAAAGFTPGYSASALEAGFEGTLFDFFVDRLRGYLRDAGHAQGAVEAVLAQRPTRIDLVIAKLDAVRVFAALPQAEALAAANKRIGNILKKAEGEIGKPEVALLQEAAEKALFQRVIQLAPQVESFVANQDYTDALKALAGVRAEVDTFFDEVMVMAEEPLVRANRLALLKALSVQMNAVADISRLAA